LKLFEFVGALHMTDLIAKQLNAICESLNLFRLASFLSSFWIDEALRFAGYTFEGIDFDSFPQLIIG
jgi:hypothetical protein